MPDLAVNPEAVIQRLASQVGQMAAELAMRDVALEAQAQRGADQDRQSGRVAELERLLAEKDSAIATQAAQIADLRRGDDGAAGVPALV